jgi:hypothetical protein
MKKLCILALVFGGFACSANAAATINLFVGQLFDQNGVPLPDNALIQVIVSTSDSNFTKPIPSSFVGGSADDVVVGFISLNSATAGGMPGADNRFVTLNYETPTNGKLLAPGMPMKFRWWSGLSASSLTPFEGAKYGEFGTASILDNSTIGWVTPANGTTPKLTFATVSTGGSQANTLGRTNLTVLPEPGTAALSLVGILGFALRRRRA